MYLICELTFFHRALCVLCTLFTYVLVILSREKSVVRLTRLLNNTDSQV